MSSRNIRVGLILKDGDHALALARGLARESRNIDIFIGERDDMDIVLTDPDTAEKSDNEVILIAGGNGENDPCDTSMEIDIYEDSRIMSNMLCGLYYDMTGRSTAYLGTRKFRIVTFCQIRGGSGATSTALSTAGMMDMLYGARVLYMNLTSVDDSDIYRMDGISESAGENMAQGKSVVSLLYLLRKEGKVPLESRIVSSRGWDRLWYGMDNRCIEDLDPPMMGKILDMIEEMGIYDYVFMDVGNQLVRSNMTVMENSDCVVLVEDGMPMTDEASRLKDHLLEKGASGILVNNKVRTWDMEDRITETCIGKIPLVVIPKDVSAFHLRDSGHVALDLKGRYGIRVGQLAKEIVRSCGGEHKERNFGYIYRDGESSKS